HPGKRHRPGGRSRGTGLTLRWECAVRIGQVLGWRSWWLRHARMPMPPIPRSAVRSGDRRRNVQYTTATGTREQNGHHAKDKHGMAKNKVAKNGNGASLGFEAELFKAADKLRGDMEPSDYKHVALGLIFLKYIS